MHDSIKTQRRRTEILPHVYDMPDGGGDGSRRSGEDLPRIHQRRKSDVGLHNTKGEESPIHVCQETIFIHICV